MFRAVLIEDADGISKAGIAELHENALPPDDVTVAIVYSTINYKDALAITSKRPVVRQLPMVPGVDLAGVVQSSVAPFILRGASLIGIDSVYAPTAMRKVA